jgi:hypothetical protein
VERISCPLSGWAVRVGEGQSLVLKTGILKTKELAEKRGELSVPGSPVAGFSETTGILRMSAPFSIDFEKSCFLESTVR